MKKIYLSIGLFLVITGLFAQSGTLDKSFNTTGKVFTMVSTDHCYGEAMVLQPDGKIIVAGSAYMGANYTDFSVVRYNINGSLDLTFSTDGKTTTDFKTKIDDATSVALQADGKIVVGGSVDSGFRHNFGIARYNSDGTQDNTFSYDGKTLIRMYPNLEDEMLEDIMVMPNGKIIAVGLANRQMVVMCLNSNGSLDMTFNGKGWLTIDFSSTFSRATTVAMQSDGKILIAGSADVVGTNSDFAVVRISANGVLDNTFSTDGKVSISIVGTDGDQAECIAIQSDGKIVLAGWTSSASDEDCAIIRLNSDGTMDNSFSGDGKLSHTILSSYDLINDILIQPDGKILAIGTAEGVSSTSYVALLRYRNNGLLDSTFGTTGIVTALIGNTDNAGNAIAMQNDGKILAAGTVVNGSGYSQIGVARFYSGFSSVTSHFISNLNLYPNPASDLLHFDYKLSISSEVSIQLIDMQGRVVLSLFENKYLEAGQRSETIDLSSITGGMYSLAIRTKDSEKVFLVSH